MKIGAAYILGLLVSLPLAASEPLQLKSRFDPAQVQWVAQPGDAEVTGTAFLVLADGARKSCAGFKVELLPVADYSSERIGLTYGNNQAGQILLEQNPPAFTPDDPGYHELLLRSQCDADGRFVFEQVPAGEYYVMVFVIWTETGSDKSSRQGGAVMQRIRVAPGARLNVAMGDRPRDTNM